jgi:hypothetical protein
MKRILFLLQLCLPLIGMAQDSSMKQVIPPKAIVSENTEKGVIRCVIPVSGEPLVIVDGIPIEFKDLQSLDPDQILTIDIFKEAKATVLFGSAGRDGVIIIRTKAQKGSVLVMDPSGEPIAGATVSMVGKRNRKNVFVAVTDSTGTAFINPIKKIENYEIVVTSVGYHTGSVPLQKNKSSVVWLAKKVSAMEEVLVETRSIRCRRIRCSTGCRSIISYDFNDSSSNAKQNKIGVYPNPVPMSSNWNLRLQHPVEGKWMLANTGGQVVQSGELNNKESLLTRSAKGLSAGMYFLRLIDSGGAVVSTQKLIVQ